MSFSEAVSKCIGHLDAKGEKNRPKKDNLLRAFACLIDYLFFCDENVTVNGVVTVVDLTKYSLKLEAYMSWEDRRDFMQTWQVRINLCLFQSTLTDLPYYFDYWKFL